MMPEVESWHGTAQRHVSTRQSTCAVNQKRREKFEVSNIWLAKRDSNRQAVG
jgi:hypothetical protein